jgi:hypothetical protein
MDLTVVSETSAKLNQTPGKYPKENIQISIYLSIYLSVYLSISVSIYSLSLSIYLSTYLPTYPWLFQNWNQPLRTKLRLLMRTYGGACTATMQCNGDHLPDVICRKLACNVWVINSILGHFYRRFRLFFPVSIYYLWPFEMCQSARRQPVFIYYLLLLFSLVLQRNAGYGLLVHEISWLHTTTHHSR